MAPTLNVNLASTKISELYHKLFTKPSAMCMIFWSGKSVLNFHSAQQGSVMIVTLNQYNMIIDQYNSEWAMQYSRSQLNAVII